MVVLSVVEVFCGSLPKDCQFSSGAIGTIRTSFYSLSEITAGRARPPRKSRYIPTRACAGFGVFVLSVLARSLSCFWGVVRCMESKVFGTYVCRRGGLISILLLVDIYSTV